MENAEEYSENSGLSLSDNGDSSLTSLGESEEEIVDSIVTPPIREVIGEEKLREYMQSKPCVYTRGEGPNGKKIDGLLLSCKKGEDVEIVCVCHGYLLSSAEFVKHAYAGGGKVENPISEILVDDLESFGLLMAMGMARNKD